MRLLTLPDAAHPEIIVIGMRRLQRCIQRKRSLQTGAVYARSLYTRGYVSRSDDLPKTPPAGAPTILNVHSPPLAKTGRETPVQQDI
jgi:hypothetical protein